jgi:hypothetical protein
MTEVVSMHMVREVVRSVIKLHCHAEDHPGGDVLVGCRMCARLLALPITLQHYAMQIELPEKGD